VHELTHDQLNHNKELLDIANQHASSEEAVGAAYVLYDGKAAAIGSRAAPSKATIKGVGKALRATRRCKRGTSSGSQSLPVATTMTKKQTNPMRSMSQPLLALIKCRFRAPTY
jgi:hypothetical protein